jgi:hypothetical protein
MHSVSLFVVAHLAILFQFLAVILFCEACLESIIYMYASIL